MRDSEGRFLQSVRNAFSKSEFLSCYGISGSVQIENIVYRQLAPSFPWRYKGRFQILKYIFSRFLVGRGCDLFIEVSFLSKGAEGLCCTLKDCREYTTGNKFMVYVSYVIPLLLPILGGCVQFLMAWMPSHFYGDSILPF